VVSAAGTDPGARLEADPLFILIRSELAGAGGGRTYVTGAAVADAIAGRRPGNILLACHAPERIAAPLAAAAGLRVVPVARRPGVLDLSREGERGITLVPLVDGGIEALARRASFTVLGMAVDVCFPGALLDPLGGEADLAGGVLRLAGPSAIEDDPERLLLAAFVRKVYEVEPDGETMRALRTHAPLARAIEARRVWRSLRGILGQPGLSDTAAFLRNSGVLEELYPEVAAIYEVPQNYYHHADVWDHTLETLDRLEEMLASPQEHFKAYGARMISQLTRRVEGGVRRRALLLLAALVHDVGKAARCSVEPSGRIRFQGHQLEGAELAASIARRTGLGGRAGRRLVAIVRDHMMLGFLMKEGETTATRLGAAIELSDRCVEVVLLSLADRLATRGEASTSDATLRFERLATRLMSDWFWLKDFPPLLDGNDIMVHSDIARGAEVARVLFKARVAQRESTVSSRAQALEFLAPDFKGKMDLRRPDGPPV
jgi:poly(A) polymerase